MVEVSSRTGLPAAFVELIAGELIAGELMVGELAHGVSRSGGARFGLGRLGAGGLRPWMSPSVRRRQRYTITAAIVALAVGSVLAAVASTVLHNTAIGVVGACGSVASVLAVHLSARRTR